MVGSHFFDTLKVGTLGEVCFTEKIFGQHISLPGLPFA
jgi:hypothetical protein